MEKKTYQKPSSKVVLLQHKSMLLADSGASTQTGGGTPSGDIPLGAPGFFHGAPVF